MGIDLRMESPYPHQPWLRRNKNVYCTLLFVLLLLLGLTLISFWIHCYCVHSLLPPVESCNHYLRPKGHELPRCDSEKHQIILDYVVSLSTCNVFLIFFYVRFYHCTACTVYLHCVRMLHVTLNINQLVFG